jgi:hypothetical protein
MLRLVTGGLVALAVLVSPVSARVLGEAGPPAVERIIPGVLVAQARTFRLRNPFPFYVDVKIHGNGPSFPHVVRVPAAPAPPVPIPYPDTSMTVQFKKPTGGWSGMFTIQWKSGSIPLPFF